MSTSLKVNVKSVGLVMLVRCRSPSLGLNCHHRDTLGSSKTLLFQTWLFALFTRMRSFALSCTLLRSFALFCERSFANLRLRSFALICALLRAFACICLFLRPTAFRTTAFGNCRHTWEVLKVRFESISSYSKQFSISVSATVTIVAFQTHTQNFSVLATQFPKSQHCPR